MENKNYRFETLALHAGHTPDTDTLSCGVPIYRTSAYQFKNTQHAADLFALKELGNIYTRLMNPTHDVLEKRVAALEGGAAALAVASGTSAIFYAIINICKNGDEIVSANNLYGGTYTMFDAILPNFGITTKFVKYDKLDEYENAISKKTRAIYVETIGNPGLGVTDIKAVSAIAKKHNLPLIVDSTFTTPYLYRPIEDGADIVVHSLTKWLGGHGTGIGGIIVDSGKFNWNQPKFSLYFNPEPSYHNLRFASDLGPLNPICFILRARLVPLRNLGACISADNAWIFLQGIETLSLRMARHCENALAVAEYLKKSPRVSWVKFSGLSDDGDNAIAKRQFKNGFGGMVVFGIKGGKEAAIKFIDSLKLFTHCANVGDAKSLVIHPASTTHSQLTEKQQADEGITPDLIRLSVGIEHSDDIIDALDEALAKT